MKLLPTLFCALAFCASAQARPVTLADSFPGPTELRTLRPGQEYEIPKDCALTDVSAYRRNGAALSNPDLFDGELLVWYTPRKFEIWYQNGTFSNYTKNSILIAYQSGLEMLTDCSYRSPETRLVIGYALNRWSRGEESQAEKGATDLSFHGIAYLHWLMVLAAAIAAADKKEKNDLPNCNPPKA